jgi:hypothetical protein
VKAVISVSRSKTPRRPPDRSTCTSSGIAASPPGTWESTVTHTYDVKRAVGERQSKRVAFAELHAIAKARLLGQFTGHPQQRGTGIDPDREAATADAFGDFPSHGAAPAADVEDVLTDGDIK